MAGNLPIGMHQRQALARKGGGAGPAGQLRNFSAFDSRLRWHCHFIQKFEMEDRMEFENVNGGYNLLNKEVNEAHLVAQASSQDGSFGRTIV